MAKNYSIIHNTGEKLDNILKRESNGEFNKLKSDFNTHAANHNNPHEVTKEQVGLGNVDNTSDLNKPISNAVQEAINIEQEAIGVEQERIDNIEYYGVPCVIDESLFNYTVSNDEVTITGIATGKTATETLVIPYKIHEVEAEYPVTTIEAGAFYGNETIVRLLIPKGVQLIKGTAFYGCVNMVDLFLSDTIERVGNNTFASCTNLKNVFYMGSKSEWDNISFGSSQSGLYSKEKFYEYVSSVDFSNYYTKTQTDERFYTKSYLNTELLKRYKNMGSATVAQLNANTGEKENEVYTLSDSGDVKLLPLSPESSTFQVSAGDRVVGNADGTWSIFTTIGGGGGGDVSAAIAEHNASSTAHENRVKNEEYYGTINIVPASTDLFNITVNTINNRAIIGSIKAGATIPANLVIPATYIYNNVSYPIYAVSESFIYSQGTTVETVVLPNTITYIDGSAFSGCSNLTTLTLCKNITNIGSGAFTDCTSLTDIYFRGTEAEWLAISKQSGNTPLSTATKHYNYVPSLEDSYYPSSVTDSKIASSIIAAISGHNADNEAHTTLTTPIYEAINRRMIDNGYYSPEDIESFYPYLVGQIYHVTETLENVTTIGREYTFTDLTISGEDGLYTIGGTDAEDFWEMNSIIVGSVIKVGTQDIHVVYVNYDEMQFGGYEVLTYTDEPITKVYSVFPIGVKAGDTIEWTQMGFCKTTDMSDLNLKEVQSFTNYFDFRLTPTSQDYFTYTINNESNATITGVTKPLSGSLPVVIPHTIYSGGRKYFVVNLSAGAFSTNASAVKTIYLPNSMFGQIPASCFSGCTSLEKIYLFYGVNNIASSAFDNCTSLTDVYYYGTETQWNNVYGHSAPNLANATKHYNYRPALVSDVSGGGGGGGTTYTFNRQFTVTNDFVSIGNEKSEVVIDLADIISEGTEGYFVDLPSDSAAKITWKGSSDIIIPTSQETTASKAANKYGKIISSTSGTLISLPAGVSYVEGMDLTNVDKVEIQSLMRDEYVDKDGYAYKYINPNYTATAIEADAATISYYRGLVNGSPQLYQSHDEITLVNLYFKDSGNYSGNDLNARFWNVGTGVNQNTYYALGPGALGQVEGAYNFGLQQYAPPSAGSAYKWDYFPYAKPTSSDDLPYLYITIKDNSGKLTLLKTVSLKEFMFDNEVNVATMNEDGRIFFKPDPDLNISLNNNYYLTMGGNLAFKNIYAIVKTSETFPTKSQTPLINTIKTYAGGRLIFIPDSNICTDASPLMGNFYTENYNVLPGAAYSNLDLGQTFEQHEGILKYQVIPALSAGLGTGEAPNGTIVSRTTPFPDVVGTKGTLTTSEGMSLEVPELFGYNNVYDEYTETRSIQRFSDDVILTTDMYYSIADVSGAPTIAIIKFKVPILSPEDAPAINSASTAANIIQSAYMVRSQEDIETMVWEYNRHSIALTYPAAVDDLDHALVTMITSKGGGEAEIKAKLKLCQFKFKYELATPKYKYNVDKLYIKPGNSVSFTTATNYVSYKDIILKAPENTEAALGMLEPITTDINDLNYRVENIEVSSEYGKIGAGDGVTDDTAAIQNAINQTANINPTYAREVVLTPGIYRISSPLKMNVENLTLRGEGEVILWATEDNYEPIIRVMVGGCKIENLKIYLAQTNDDVNYTNNETDPWLWGYTKSYKESVSANAEGNGRYSGIYVDTGLEYDGEGNYGFFNLTVRDVTVQGAFRYSTKFIEKSYGIYFPKTGYCYFNTIDNCLFNSVMCGLFLGSGGTPTDVNCKFDIGDDIYNTGASGNADTFQFKNCYNVMGCRYGVVVYSISNTIRIDGQSVGGDSMNPYVYDDNNREVPLDEHTPVEYRESDSQAYEYDAANHAFVEISGGKVSGFPKNVGEWRKVTDAGIVMHGRLNKIEGMIFDHQRTTYGGFYLTSSSSNCLYNSYSSGGVSYGRTDISWLNHMYIPVTRDANNKFIEWAAWDNIMSSTGVTDCGLGNRNTDTNMLENEHKYGAGVISSLDKYGMNYAFPRTIDKTDDVAAYADVIGSVKCYYVIQDSDDWDEVEKEEITQFYIGHPSKNVTTSDISPLFRPNCDISPYGVSTGITFEQIPSHDHPIVIEIDFDQKPIMGISSGIIRFNQFIGQEIGFSFYTTFVGDWSKYYNFSNYNTNGEFFWNTYNHNTSQHARETIEKIHIKLGSAYMPTLQNAVTYYDGETSVTYAAGTNYNPNGYVGISKIFIGDTNGGGRAFLPRGGGDVYGNINASGILESKSGTIKLGNTTLTEQQLQSLLAIIS